MNKTYALVWNPTQRCWNAVGETARRRGKSSGGKRVAAAAVSLLGLAALPAFALPTGEAITAGKADIVRTDDGRSMNINQHTDKLVTNWQDFSIGGGERVSFRQPGSQSVALNRVIGNNGSRIDGQIEANGKVFLVNPNGVMFGAGAQINVGGLVASTQNLSDADFLAGRYRFSGTSAASIVNDGTITAADGGSVALLGARVSNNGVIHAKLGRVALGAGNTFNVNFDGNGLLNLQVEGGAVDAQAHNGGLLKADGGEVLMTARAAGNLLGAVINNSGTIEAKGLASRGGRITLDGGTVKVAGKLDASAAEAGSPAGTVVTRGERVDVAHDVQVDTRAGNAAGKWTIEAANAGVNGTDAAGRSIDADTLSRNLGTTNVELANTQGDLTVGGPVSWTSDNALTLTSRKGNVDLQKTLQATGANANLVVNAAGKIRVNDAVKLTGDNAHLELNSAKGHTLTNDKAVVTLSGKHASYRSNGEDYTVLHTVDDLRNVDANLNGRYVLGNALDGNGANFRSIGGDHSFTGVFDGLGNTVSRLKVTNPGKAVVGLFGVNAGRIANLALQSITATGSTQYGSPVSVGALAGYNFGTISNVKASDVVVTAKGYGASAGGLVGSNLSGTIDGASVSGRVDGDHETAYLGGLVGENVTLHGGAAARISNSHANVRVTAARDAAAGGLVGYNAGVIADSSSAGSVVATGNAAMIGGLVGVNERGATIERSSSSAIVTAGANAVAGGLVGANDGMIDASRATGAVTVGDAGIAGGLVGKNNGDILASTADGDVKAGASSNVGGLVGANDGQIQDSRANGAVMAAASSRAGGLVGVNGAQADIRGSVAHGNVTVDGIGTLGGLVGLNEGLVETSDAHGTVTASDDSTAGGLVGVNNGSIDAARAFGNVRAGKSSKAGGLAGVNAGYINASEAAGKVAAGLASMAGGLVGVNTGIIAQSKASGAVSAGVGSQLGGLVGLNERGSILHSSASGDVDGDMLSDIGGLVGRHASGLIESSRATGSVKGTGTSNVGGLVGNNSGTVNASSSSGNVSGSGTTRLGGLIGSNYGWVNQSTTSSRVAFTDGSGNFRGALAGLNFGSLNGNTATGAATSVRLVGINFGRLKD
ncbi:filamentous hemagglutinin N-terminal domain-containing protein [Burkholderia cenocepacia]|uniref:two-partner secretion domain-containing protein n=3 Tax=Burkholderia cenocepacia TaxID=95486 RepID=UPI001F45AB2D|nr:GLUG motif-containing protein [Burkholderia cenocepacia]MCF1369853.1 filamentous hemagglutinin N-terminal domain-containing protein [Burkholderia cenocepacia]MCF1386116.1 filamentous hemagglutinin N-terminal domain-containing protein [Burkholderia cenocepacia]